MSSLVFMLIAAVSSVPYLPVRGAITYGDFLVNERKQIIIGEALREAYKLEKEQEWMGCCLSDLCYKKVKDYKSFEIFSKKGVLIKYSVPFKHREEDKYVINMESFSRIWGKESKKIPITDSNFIKNIFINKTIDCKNLLELGDKEEIKLKNTQDFFHYIEEIKQSFE